VEEKGRIAICGINSVFTDFIAGNTVFDGVCTGKGLKGKASDLNALLMNVIDWLGEPSLQAGRKTLGQSLTESFAIQPFGYPPRLKVKGDRALEPIPGQFQGIVGVRSSYSGGSSTVGEYAAMARQLGLDYLVFLEDYSQLSNEDFERLKSECESLSDSKLLLIPGIRGQNIYGARYFGFKVGLKLPTPLNLQPGTKLLTTIIDSGHHKWSLANGGRSEMACGNYRINGEEPAGVPASDYKTNNPFISVFTAMDGKLSDTMLDTYLKCAARTEWVSPIAIDLIDSAEGLAKAAQGDGFKTVYLRNHGEGLNSLRTSLGERGNAYPPVTYVTNGPRIEEWRSSGPDFDGSMWDWTRYRFFVKMAVSSENGLKEIKVMDGTREIRRFLPRGATRFEKTLLFTHANMQNLILIATDNKGRQAISDEQWLKNQILQLNWCQDRNNMLGNSNLPAPLSASGTTSGNYPVPWSMEKCGFRETLVPAVNMDLSRLPGFDGQPYGAAFVSPAPLITSVNATEGAGRISRDIGRELCSPDAAIQTATARLVSEKSVERPAPSRPGPVIPMELFHADLRYTTFIHPGHLPAPVLLEGTIKILKDLTFADDVPMGIQILEMRLPEPEDYPDDYNKISIQRSRSGDVTQTLSSSTRLLGAFNKGASILSYPSKFGAVGLFSLDDNLEYTCLNRKIRVGYRMAGKSVKAGTEFKYRTIVFAEGRGSALSSPEAAEDFQSQLGLSPAGTVSYQVNAEHGSVLNQHYILSLDGKGLGFAGSILLPEKFPCVLPIIVKNLNKRWSSVLYDRRSKTMRPLGMEGGQAYCHRAPEEREGEIFIGHPFTSNNENLWLMAVQTGEHEMTLQIHNPTEHPISASIKRTPYFDMVEDGNFDIEVAAGEMVERKLH
jgi:hypothetical protein